MSKTIQKKYYSFSLSDAKEIQILNAVLKEMNVNFHDLDYENNPYFLTENDLNSINEARKDLEKNRVFSSIEVHNGARDLLCGK